MRTLAEDLKQARLEEISKLRRKLGIGVEGMSKAIARRGLAGELKRCRDMYRARCEQARRDADAQFDDQQSALAKARFALRAVEDAHSRNASREAMSLPKRLAQVMAELTQVTNVATADFVPIGDHHYESTMPPAAEHIQLDDCVYVIANRVRQLERILDKHRGHHVDPDPVGASVENAILHPAHQGRSPETVSEARPDLGTPAQIAKTRQLAGVTRNGHQLRKAA